MNDLEKGLVRKMLHEAADKDLPVLVEDILARFHMDQQPVVKMGIEALLPKVIALLDEKIEKLVK